MTDSPHYKELTEVTPARQSARTAGKTFKFAEASSGDDFIGNGNETPEEDDEKVDTETRKNKPQTKNSSPVVFEVDNDDNAGLDSASGQCKRTGKKAKKDMNQPISTSEASKLMKGGKRIEERESGTVTKEQKKQPKRKELLDSDTLNQRKSKSASGTSSSKRGQVGLIPSSQSSDPDDSTQVEDDDIEEFSSTSKDNDASDDEDWTA